MMNRSEKKFFGSYTVRAGILIPYSLPILAPYTALLCCCTCLERGQRAAGWGNVAETQPAFLLSHFETEMALAWAGMREQVGSLGCAWYWYHGAVQREYLTVLVNTCVCFE